MGGGRDAVKEEAEVEREQGHLHGTPEVLALPAEKAG